MGTGTSGNLEMMKKNCQAQGPTPGLTQGQGQDQGQDMIWSGQVKLRLKLQIKNGT